MSEAILTEWSAPAVIDAIEANGEAWWRHYRHAPQADVHDERELLWLTSGIPIKEYSGVARASFDPDRAPEEIDRHITRIQTYFSAHQVGMQWIIGPSTRPTHLGERLEQHGFLCQGSVPGMAAQLERLPRESDTPPRLEIVRVANTSQLQEWVAVAGEAYGESARIQQARFGVHAAFGFAEDAPLQRYLARLDGRPVAMSELFLAAGVAGIYDVATTPRARGQGIGAAITHVPLLAARARGYQVGVLEASPMGEPSIGGWDLRNIAGSRSLNGSQARGGKLKHLTALGLHARVASRATAHPKRSKAPSLNKEETPSGLSRWSDNACNQIHSNQALQAGVTAAMMRRPFGPDPRPQDRCPHRQSNRLPDSHHNQHSQALARRRSSRRRRSFSSRSLLLRSSRHSQATVCRHSQATAHRHNQATVDRSFSHPRRQAAQPGHSSSHHRRAMACRPRAIRQPSRASAVPRQGSAGHPSRAMARRLWAIPRSQASLVGQ